MTTKPDSRKLEIDAETSPNSESQHDSDFLRRFAASIDADCAGLLRHKPSEEDFQLITWRHSEDATAEYLAHYGRFDPLRKLLARKRDGAITIDTFVEPAYQQPEWRHDYLKRHGIRYLLVSAWRDSENRHHFIGFQRYKDARPFSDSDVKFSNRLLAGWTAEQLILQSGSSSRVDTTLIGNHILDRTDLCVVLVDENLRVHFANQKALQILNSAKGILIQSSLIKANNAMEQHILTKQVNKVINGMITTPMHLGTGSARLLLVLSPFMVSARPFALMLAKPTDVPNEEDFQHEAFSKAFNLTKAEGRLANALGRGETIDNFACRTGIALTTARNQLRAVFHKTGTSRQVELVRLFCRFPDVQD